MLIAECPTHKSSYKKRNDRFHIHMQHSFSYISNILKKAFESKATNGNHIKHFT